MEEEVQNEEKIRERNQSRFASGIAVGLLFGFIIGLVGGTMTELPLTTVQGQTLDEFAQCLTDKGIEMYGAHWCPWCQEQEKLFGMTSITELGSFEYIDYIECGEDVPEGWKFTTDIQKCQSAGISGFPSWKYNGEIMSGMQSLEKLSEWSGCELPEDV